MRRLFLLFVGAGRFFKVPILTLAVVSLAGVAIAQQQGSANAPSSSQSSQQQGSSASAPNDIPTPDDEPGAATDSKQAQSSDQQADEKQPTRGERLKKHMKDQMSSWCVGAPVSHCYEKDPNAKAEQKGDKNTAQNPRAPRSDDPESEDPATAAPATPGESSSKDTKIDLSPPPGDANEHPDSSVEDAPSSTTEFRPWDPHRAMKNVEVGDYYFKQGNYRAAASRYQEALQWKPRDAEATFKLANAYDKLGDFIDARNNYEQYLKILPKGPRAEDAHKAMARLK